MAGIECYIKELDDQRDKLAHNLVEKGVEADENEKFNSLVQKVLDIQQGGEQTVYIERISMPVLVGFAGVEEVEE